MPKRLIIKRIKILTRTLRLHLLSQFNNFYLLLLANIQLIYQLVMNLHQLLLKNHDLLLMLATFMPLRVGCSEHD